MTVFLTILFFIAAWGIIHTFVGLGLMRFFVAFNTKDHAKGLCSSETCRPEESYSHGGYYSSTHLREVFREEYLPNERRDACVVATSKRMSLFWIPALFSIVPQILATKHLSTAKADAARLAKLEAEQAEREVEVNKILEEMRTGETDLDLFAKALASAPLVQVAPKGKN